MTTIGYATLQIIPSLQGVSDSINKQLGFLPGQGKTAGKALGGNIAAGVRGSEPQISAALAQAVNARGGEKAGQQWADSTASAMAKHLQSAQNSQKLQSSLTYLVKNGDAAGKKFAADMASQLAIELPIQTRAQQVGEKVGTVIGRSIGFGIKAAAAGAVAGIAGIGYTLTKGFERLQSIDQATFKLKALGHSGDEVKTIMDNALASVKGTSFGLADAATAAASAVAAGVKPGQDLTKYLTEISDAAAVAGTSFSDMGAIFNSIQTLNKAFTGDLRQLSDRGLPIFEWLQKEYGVTAEKLNEMVQKGEVDSAHFKDAIDKNIGGAAKNMGQSFDGAVQNLEASVARLGANFITAILGGDPANALAGPTEAITRLTTKFDEIGVWVTAHKDQIHQFFATVADDVKAVAGFLGDVGGFLTEHPHLIEAVVIAFAGWKAITAIGAVVTSLGAISTALGLLPAQAEVAGAGIGGGLGKGLGGLGFLLRAGVWTLPVAIVATILWGDRDNNPKTQTSGGTGQPQLPGVNLGGPGSTTPNFATGPALPPDTPVPPGFEIRDGQLVKITPAPNHGGGRAAGGSIFGPGTSTSDSVPIMASVGEHVLTAKDVHAMGGQGGVYAFRSMLHRSGGGPIPLGADWIPRDPRRNADRQNPSQFPDRGPRGDRSYKGPYNYGGDDVKRPGIWEGGTGWWATHGLPYQGKIRFPKDRFNPNDPNRKNRKNVVFLGAAAGFNGGGAVGYGLPGSTNTGGYGTGTSGTFPPWVMQLADYFGIKPSTYPGHQSSDRNEAGYAPNPQHLNRGIDWSGSPENMQRFADYLATIPQDLEQVIWPGGLEGTGKTVEIAGGRSQPGYFAGDLAGHAGANAHVHTRQSGPIPLPGQAADAAVGAGSSTGLDLSRLYVDGLAQGGQNAVKDLGSSSSSSASGGASLPSSISGLSSFGLAGLGSGIGTTGSGSDLSLFGNAAATAVSGQVSSALGVLGVGDNPPFLQAASKLLGGLKVGGHGHPGQSDGSIFDGSNLFGGGRSAAPLSAGPSGTGTPPPDDPGNMHGTRAGQQPGPTYNITARDTEDAFIRAQRIEREKAAAKLSRF